MGHWLGVGSRGKSAQAGMPVLPVWPSAGKVSRSEAPNAESGEKRLARQPTAGTLFQPSTRAGFRRTVATAGKSPAVAFCGPPDPGYFSTTVMVDAVFVLLVDIMTAFEPDTRYMTSVSEPLVTVTRPLDATE